MPMRIRLMGASLLREMRGRLFYLIPAGPWGLACPALLPRAPELPHHSGTGSRGPTADGGTPMSQHPSQSPTYGGRAGATPYGEGADRSVSPCTETFDDGTIASSPHPGSGDDEVESNA